MRSPGGEEEQEQKRETNTLRQVVELLAPRSDRRLWRYIVGAALLVVAGGAVSAVTPLALRSLVDSFGTSRTDPVDATMVSLHWGLAYLALLCAARVLSDLRPLLSGAVTQRVHGQLTRQFFDHLLGVPMAFLLRQRSGGLVHSLNLASAGAQLLVTHAINSTLPVVVELVSMTVILIHLGQPVLVVIIGITALAYFGIFTFGSRRLRSPSLAVSDASIEVHAQLNDGIAHMEALRCFGAESKVRQQLLVASQSLDDHWSRHTRLNACIAIAASAVFAISTAACLVAAAQAIGQGTLTIGGFVLANVYMLQMVRPLEILGSATRDYARALGYLRPLLTVLAETSKANPPGGDSAGSTENTATADRKDRVSKFPALGRRKPSSPAPTLRIENLHFDYAPGRPALRGVDLVIKGGSTTAIVGRSGSGKSTLARLLMRLYEPDAGRILLDEWSIETLPLAELRSLIALVTQDTALLHTSIADNIALGSHDASQADIERAARLAQLERFIGSLPQGYSTLVGERGLQLSGGERQRIAIARALLRRPAMYILDEPTSMLDSTTEAEIMNALRGLTSDSTTIVIAHRLSSVLHADDIVVLDDGRVVEQGCHRVLLAKDGLYAHMWRQQMAGSR